MASADEGCGFRLVFLVGYGIFVDQGFGVSPGHLEPSLEPGEVACKPFSAELSKESEDVGALVQEGGVSVVDHYPGGGSPGGETFAGGWGGDHGGYLLEGECGAFEEC